MESRIVAALRIVGFTCHHSDVTTLLGIEPTAVWLKDELVSKSGRGTMRHHENGWALSFEDKSEDSPLIFQRLFDRIGQTLIPVKEKFLRLPQGSIVHFACAAYICKNTPAFSLDCGSMKLLADINGSLDLDIYCLGGSETSE